MSAEDRAKVEEAKKNALQATEAAFEGLDKDGSGSVEREELASLMSAQAGGAGVDNTKIQEFFDTFDENGDGKVSKAEWLTFFGNMFDSTMNENMNSNQ